MPQLYCEVLLKDYIDRVSGRQLYETSTSEMAIDGQRPPYIVTRSGIFVVHVVNIAKVRIRMNVIVIYLSQQ
jgi:hypothetical protein